MAIPHFDPGPRRRAWFAHATVCSLVLLAAVSLGLFVSVFGLSGGGGRSIFGPGAFVVLGLFVVALAMAYNLASTLIVLFVCADARSTLVAHGIMLGGLTLVLAALWT